MARAPAHAGRSGCAGRVVRHARPRLPPPRPAPSSSAASWCGPHGTGASPDSHAAQARRLHACIAGRLRLRSARGQPFPAARHAGVMMMVLAIRRRLSLCHCVLLFQDARHSLAVCGALRAPCFWAGGLLTVRRRRPSHSSCRFARRYQLPPSPPSPGPLLVAGWRRRQMRLRTPFGTRPRLLRTWQLAASGALRAHVFGHASLLTRRRLDAPMKRGSWGSVSVSVVRFKLQPLSPHAIFCLARGPHG